MPVQPIRPASSGDQAAWARMRLLLFDDLDPAFNQADMDAFSKRKNQRVLLATDAGGTVAGFAEVALRNLVDGCLTSPVGYLEAIYVEPAARGLGLGKELLDAAIGWASEQGCTEFATDSALDDVAAQRFHLAMGMKETFRIVQFRLDI